MLTAHVLSMPFAGGFHGTAAIENLQIQLTALAQATNRPDINPGPVNGVVDTQMIGAVAGSVGWLTAELGLPAVMGAAIALAATMAPNNATAKAFAIETITTYAAQLTLAYTALVVKYTGSSLPPPPSGGSMPPVSTKPWAGKLNTSFLQTTSFALPPRPVAPGSGLPGETPSNSFLIFPRVPPGTPWYKNYKIWAGVGGVMIAGGVAYKVFSR